LLAIAARDGGAAARMALVVLGVLDLIVTALSVIAFAVAIQELSSWHLNFSGDFMPGHGVTIARW
jgi:hypothetical protein